MKKIYTQPFTDIISLHVSRLMIQVISDENEEMGTRRYNPVPDGSYTFPWETEEDDAPPCLD